MMWIQNKLQCQQDILWCTSLFGDQIYLTALCLGWGAIICTTMKWYSEWFRTANHKSPYSLNEKKRFQFFFIWFVTVIHYTSHMVHPSSRCSSSLRVVAFLLKTCNRAHFGMSTSRCSSGYAGTLPVTKVLSWHTFVPGRVYTTITIAHRRCEVQEKNRYFPLSCLQRSFLEK